tara:strand:+ start:171 stop:560 length:390 start_codon:yes stop_codon:yes gene_type:complete
MKKILIVVSRYNDTNFLLNSTKQVLTKTKIKFKTIKVNGAFEIPVTISRNIKKFDAFIALGIIIKGETLNFEFISQAITNGLINLSISSKKPIGNGILTCYDSQQAIKRSNKGAEAAEAVIDVLNQKLL